MLVVPGKSTTTVALFLSMINLREAGARGTDKPAFVTAELTFSQGPDLVEDRFVSFHGAVLSAE